MITIRVRNKKDGVDNIIGEFPQEFIGHFNMVKEKSDPSIEIEDITLEVEERKKQSNIKKKAIKDAVDAITDPNMKKVLKYLIRNIDNENE